jgi:hypothetical protein
VLIHLFSALFASQFQHAAKNHPFMTRSPGRTHSDTFLRALSQSRQVLCKIMRMWQCRDTTGQKFTISEVQQWGASLHRTKILARSWHIFTRICCFADSHSLFYLSLSKLICEISKPAYWQETPLAWGYSNQPVQL